MKKHTLYKILSYLLLPVAAIMGFFTLIFLFVALGNPAMLLPVFMLACTVIYIITSFIFLNKGIMMRKRCRRGLKDWIKVNAYVSVVFSIMTLIQIGGIIFQPDLMNKMIDESASVQPNYPNVSKELMQQMAKAMLYFLFGFSLLLLIHTSNTFRLLRNYRHIFEEPSANDPQ